MDQYKLGTVLIFEAEDDWLGKCIAKLTQSNVCHAAMVYGEGSMVEMGSTGVQVNGFREDEDGQPVYLMRLVPERDPAPLITAADVYLGQKVRFDFPDLVLLGGLLIYRAIRPTPRWQKITDIILSVACWELDQILNRLLHKGDKTPAMVCSQLVYQCFHDCGKGYEIILKDALLQDTIEVRGETNSGEIRLADLVGDAALDITAAPKLPPQDNISPDPEALAKELYESLDEAEELDCTCFLQAPDLSDTMGNVMRFLDLVEQILERSGINLPVPALFVAPSDLLEHAENLEQFAQGKIKRILS